MIQMLVKKELIAQIRKARDADCRWRKDVRLLGDKILPPIVLAYGKAGNVGSYWRERVGRRTRAVHVAEIQRVRKGKIMIQAQSELVIILAQGLRASKSIRPVVRLWEEGQDVLCNWINRSQLAVGNQNWLTGGEIKEGLGKLALPLIQ